MIKTWMFVFSFFLLLPSAQSVQTSPAGRMSSAGETRYFVRLSNCDDFCRADLGDVNNNITYFGSIRRTEFGEDSGWIDFTDTLQPGSNNIRLLVFNTTGGIAYGFQIKKNNTLVFEQICGRAGASGCENNRVFPKSSIARTFSYDIFIPPTEIPIAYQRWLSFYEAFRAAVNKRDGVALKRLISASYAEGGTPDGIVRQLNRGNGWRELQKSVASGTKPAGLNSKGRPERWTKNGMYSFEFGADGQWRWSGENVGD